MKKWTVSKTTSYLLAAILGATTSAVSSADQAITSIRVAPGQGNTRVVFDLTGPTPYKLFTLDNPSRVVVDFIDTNSLAKGIGIPSEALVTNVRSAVQADNALRMVLDLKQAAGVKGFILPPDGQAGHRLVVDISPATGGAYTSKPISNSGNATNGAIATASIGAAHIYGGNPFGNGSNAVKTYSPVTTAGKAPVAAVPVESRAAVKPGEPSDADIAAIKALLDPQEKASVTSNGSGLLEAKPAAESTNVSPPPVVAAKSLESAAIPNVSMAPKSSASAPTPVTSKTNVNVKANTNANASAASKSDPIAKAIEKAQPAASAKPVLATATKPVVPAPLPAIKTAPKARPGNLREVIVAIDAGHGGQDPGAIGPSGIREKYITLAIARALREELSRQEGVKAELVRSGDYFIPLASRRDIARTRLKADLFVSIHADAALHRKARGASVFALSRNGATSSLAQMLADRENQSDLVGGALEDKDKMVASVIADLALEGAMEHSMKVGGTVLKELAVTTPLHKRHIEKAGFAVLKSADFPSILVETGFISNPQEEKNLRNTSHQQRLAQAITRGVMHYFNGNPPPGTYLAWKRDKGATVVAAAAETQHRISRGDTLEKIASRYQVGLSDLRRANAITSNDTIKVGQVLQIPDT